MYGQEKKQFRIHTVAFYNLENLFDTINDPNKYDEASPIMRLKVNRRNIYERKIKNMARVIADIGSEVTNNSPAILGVAEIENHNVLEDLVKDTLLMHKDYGIVHFNSPDARGIDVALLYQKRIFTPWYTSKHTLKIYEHTGRRIYTRDQLLVSGDLEEEPIHILINHWPSRRGGEAKSEQKRIAASKLNKRIVDSLQSLDPYAKIFIMGDLNDNPTNKSVKAILKTSRDKKSLPLKGLYNPFEVYFSKGLGTTAYRDSWSLFDQIIVSKPLLKKDFSTFRFYKAGIFNKRYLTHRHGRYKGYPKRSFDHSGFTNGFSDHFPVYMYVIKELPFSPRSVSN